MQLSPEQFHTLFDRAAQPVLLVQDGVITQCSSRAEGLIAPGSPIRELLPPDAVLQELIAAASTVLPLRLRTGYVTAQVQPLEGALLLFLPVGDDDACTSALSRAAQAVSAPLTTRDHFPASGGRGGSGPAAESGGAQPVVLSAAARERESWRLERRAARAAAAVDGKDRSDRFSRRFFADRG